MSIDPLSAEEMSRVRTAIRQHGERSVLEASGVSRNALSRALAGLPVRPGTVALIRSALAGFAPESHAPTAA